MGQQENVGQQEKEREEFVLRGIDSKRRLLGFFGAKNHHNLVLRIVDVLELVQEDIHWLIAQIVAINGAPATGWLRKEKQWLLHVFPTGWIVIPLNRFIESLNFKEMERLQSIVFSYKSVRQGKGEPYKREQCTKCKGKGCNECCDEGYITTFMEMSDEERELAERGFNESW